MSYDKTLCILVFAIHVFATVLYASLNCIDPSLVMAVTHCKRDIRFDTLHVVTASRALHYSVLAYVWPASSHEGH